MNSEYDVSLVACKSYEEQNLKDIMADAIDKIGGMAFLKPGMTVGIKANLVAAMNPAKAGTTHFALISALCDILLERGAEKVIIGDSPGGLYTGVYLSHVYAVTGMKALESENVSLNNDFSTELIENVGGKVLKSFTCTAWLRNVDAIINFSKLKTHGMMGMSAAVKNLFGTIPGTMKAEFHSLYPDHGHFADMLVDLNEFWKPSLCICDAVVAMEGNGPTAGTPRYVGALLASKSPYMLDCVAARIISLTSDRVPTLGAANARFPGLCDIKNIGIYGNPDDFAVPDFNNIAERKNIDFGNFGDTPIKKAMYKIAGHFTRSKPKPIKKNCIGCGKCANVCPQKTIDIVNKKAVIHRKNCIRCFCCQEFCPVGAMVVQRPFIGKLLAK